MKNLQNFLDDLGKRESSGNYKTVNKYGYLGKYQMGEMALIDTGYYKKSSKKFNNDWSGMFVGKDNIYSKDDFLNSPEIQEKAQKEFMKIQWRYIKIFKISDVIGDYINGIKITQSGLLASVHLCGIKSVVKYIRSNGVNIAKDGFNTSLEEYLKNFADYDVSEICS